MLSNATTINSSFSFGTNGVIFILAIVARWLIFQKMGEKGWKAIIPIYSDYILYSRVWRVAAFWLMLFFGAVGTIGLTITGLMAGLQITYLHGAISDSALIALFICLLILLIPMIISIMLNNHLSKAFGHGTGFTLGLIFLNPIFLLVLALEKNEYLGPEEY
ncbi:MAG: DUF5684 domain-containing protein [Eubacteriales bacterium]|nr:DUF5684 domain-containing protein [Eubacteriales bacterium]